VIGSRKLEECFQLILTTFSSYCEKVGELKDSIQREKFYEQILSGLTVTQELEPDATEDDKIEGAVSFLKKMSGSVRKPAKAVEHLKTLSSFHSLFPDNEIISAAVGRSSEPVIQFWNDSTCDKFNYFIFLLFVVDVAESYLKTNWKLMPAQVDLMLRTWVLKSSAPLNVMRTIVSSLVTPDHDDLEGCNSTNFHTWYSVLLALLSQHVAKNVSLWGQLISKIVVYICSNFHNMNFKCMQGKRALTAGNGISFWKEAVLMLKDLVIVTETHRETPIFTALLKVSFKFL